MLLAAVAGLAGILVIGVLIIVLRRRASGRSGKTVFEKVEKAHQKDRVGQIVKQREDSFLSIVYGLAAAMIVADGRIEQAEIEQAETLGKRLIPNFNHDDFMKIIRGHKSLPRFNDMVDTVAPLLPMEAKIEIFDFLQAIATADGQISPDERHYIHHVQMQFEIDKLD
jgi:uncharacterized tellurite resistance protein B-like protein